MCTNAATCLLLEYRSLNLGCLPTFDFLELIFSCTLFSVSSILLGFSDLFQRSSRSFRRQQRGTVLNFVYAQLETQSWERREKNNCPSLSFVRDDQLVFFADTAENGLFKANQIGSNWFHQGRERQRHFGHPDLFFYKYNYIVLSEEVKTHIC